jgi:DNA polymerase-3 subunit epsilon
VTPLSLYRADGPHELEPARVAGLFRNRHTARRHLETLTRQQGLCPRALGIETGAAGRPCFQHQLGRCRGACCGAESMRTHNRRLHDALRTSRLGAWPWPDAALISEKRPGFLDVHVVSHWCYLGTGGSRRQAVQLASRNADREMFDLDLYRILLAYFEHNGDRLEIEPVTTARSA